MTIALLPLRSLKSGKRRLQTSYAIDFRTRLVQALFQRVVATLAASSAVSRTVVVSPDHELISWAERFGVETVQQPGLGLNEGLEYARQVVRSRFPGVPLMVVLPDLPLIEAAEIDAVASLGAERTIVVAPDRHGTGTNALWLPSAAPLPFAFGNASFERHRRAASTLGFCVQCYHSPGLALDIDTAEDLELARRSTDQAQVLP